MIRFSWGAASDVGRVRTQNQDCALVTDRLVAVADGMGGHAAGEVASELALETLRAAAADPSLDSLVAAVQAANAVIWDAAGDPDLRGMGTTLSVLALVAEPDDPRLALANVGDSRIYRLTDGELEQRSQDHTLVEEMVREGRITAAQARRHPRRNVITRALGIADRVLVDTWDVEPEVGDRWLLCSDGLVNEVAEPKIAATLRAYADPTEAARELVRLANDAGGHDNITCVVVDIVDDDGTTSAATGDRIIRPRADEVADLAGFATATGASERRGAGALDDDEADDLAERSMLPRMAVESDPLPRRFTLRTLLFLLAMVVVFATAAGGVAWYARNAYFVDIDASGEVVIYQGRPDGLLWFDPTFVESSGIAADDLTPVLRAGVEARREFASVAAARRFVANLADQLERLRPPPTTSTTTTTSTTSTTVAPGPGGTTGTTAAGSP